MIKKGLLFIVVLIGMIGLNTGFFNKHMDMNFVKKPSMLYIVSNMHEKEINVLIQKLEQLQKEQGTESEQMVLNQAIQELYAKDVVESSDQTIVNLVFNELNSTNKLFDVLTNGMKKSKAVLDNGVIMPPKEGLYYKVYFQYNVQIPQNSNEEIINAIKEGYIPYIFLFPNNLAYVPLYDENQKGMISTVKIRFGQDQIDKFTSYYKSNLPK